MSESQVSENVVDFGSKIGRCLTDKQKRLVKTGINIDIVYVDMDTSELKFNTTRDGE